MRLRDSETPIEAEIPTRAPETAADAAATTARIDETSLAVSTTSPSPAPVPVVVTVLSAMNAFVLVRMTFVASAPAPLIEAAMTLPPLAASDAATARLSIAAALVALSVTSPTLAVTPELTPLIDATTSASISLRATVAAIDRAPPPPPPKPAARDAPSARALILEVSAAVRVTLSAEMPWIAYPVLPSPEIVALTSVMIVFFALDPAPLSATPPTPPTATAPDAATTTALITWSAMAVSSRSPSAWTAEVATYARTSSGSRAPASERDPIEFSAIETPIEAPTPAVPPVPIASEAATIVAAIVLVLFAWRATSPEASTELSTTKAFVLPRMELRA